MIALLTVTLCVTHVLVYFLGVRAEQRLAKSRQAKFNLIIVHREPLERALFKQRQREVERRQMASLTADALSDMAEETTTKGDTTP